MKMGQILGIAVAAVGIVLLGFAYNATEAPVEQLSNTLTGRYRDETMWYFVAGTASIVTGGLMALFWDRT